MSLRRRTTSPAVLAALGLALVVSLVTRLLGQAPSLTLLARDTRRSIPLTILNDQELVSLEDLAGIFQLSVREEGGTVTVTSKGRTVVFNPEQTIASVAGRMISLPTRPARAGGRLLVPVDFISRAIAPIYDGRVELRRASHLLIVGDLRVPRVTITAEALASGYKLILDATPHATSTLTRDADHMTIKFEAEALDLSLPAISPQGFVQGIRRIDPVTIAIDLGPRFGSYRSSTQAMDAITRITLELLPSPAEAPPPPGPAAPTLAPSPTTTAGAPPADLPVFGQSTSPVRTVTIDAGHGGRDEGATGAGGATEKALTLAVARRVKSSLEGRLGLRVLMTREDDREVPLEARTAVANNNKSDLFISLHANASFRATASGTSILVAQFPDEGLTRQTFEPHRVPVFGGGMRDIEVVIWNQAQSRHVSQSLAFADTLRQALQPRVPLDVRPVDRAPLRVLASANMPAVLVELGYLSNAEQERRLGSADVQSGIADAVVDAVVAFRDYLSRTPEVER